MVSTYLPHHHTGICVGRMSFARAVSMRLGLTPSLCGGLRDARGQHRRVNVAVARIRGRARFTDHEFVEGHTIGGDLEERGLGPCRRRSCQQAGAGAGGVFRSAFCDRVKRT